MASLAGPDTLFRTARLDNGYSFRERCTVYHLLLTPACGYPQKAFEASFSIQLANESASVYFGSLPFTAHPCPRFPIKGF